MVLHADPATTSAPTAAAKETGQLITWDCALKKGPFRLPPNPAIPMCPQSYLQDRGHGSGFHNPRSSRYFYGAAMISAATGTDR